MFKKLVVLMSMLAVMAIASVSFAAEAVSRAALPYIDAARTQVPMGANFITYTMEADECEVQFFDNVTLLEYHVEYAVPSQVLKEVTIKGSNSAKSTTVVKSVEDIKEIVTTAYPNATDIVVELDKDGQYYEYDAKFVTPEYRVEAELNPVTGAFAKREHKYVK